jgi:D-xylonolactonase
MNSCSVVVNDGNPCGESPVWDVSARSLYWTDSAGRFFSYDWDTKARAVLLHDFMIAGCALNDDGGLVLINGSGVWHWDGGTAAPRRVAPATDREPLPLNDCIADPHGRLIAGSTFYDPAAAYPLGQLLAIDPAGEIRVLDEGFHLANGLGWSPDDRILYFTDSITRTIYRYDYDVESGSVRNRRVFARVEATAGLPDGLTVDAEGFVWSAEWYGSCITRYDPDGARERRVHLPAKQTSSLAFGGPELRHIFVTSAAKSEPTPVMPPGYDAVNGYFGGALFLVDCDIQGRAEYRARLRAR